MTAGAPGGGVYVGLRTFGAGENVPPAPPSLHAKTSANWLLASVSATLPPSQVVLSAPAPTSGQQTLVIDTTSLPSSASQAAAVELSVHSVTSSSGSRVRVSVESGQDRVIRCVKGTVPW